MLAYEDALLRSLIDRANALGSYVRSMQARDQRTDDAFAVALEMCHRYTELFIRQVTEDWDRSPDDESRAEIVQAWVTEFF